MIFRLPSAEQAHRQWSTAVPFPHVEFSDTIYPDEAAVAAREFPPPSDSRWKTYTGPLEAGKQEAPAEIAGTAVAAIHDRLASDEFVGWLRTVSGIPNLIADPTRLGGGIHQAAVGGRLARHVDFNVHPAIVDPFLLRAVNVILFVGDTVWPPGVGGTLWLGELSRATEVYPQPGLLVAFEASDDSWHGHPDPILDGAPLRRSIPAYYYRPIRDGETVEAHSTRFLDIERGNCPHKRGIDCGPALISEAGPRCPLCYGTL